MLMHCLHAVHALLADSMHLRYFNEEYVVQRPRLLDMFVRRQLITHIMIRTQKQWGCKNPGPMAGRSLKLTLKPHTHTHTHGIGKPLLLHIVPKGLPVQTIQRGTQNTLYIIYILTLLHGQLLRGCSFRRTASALCNWFENANRHARTKPAVRGMPLTSFVTLGRQCLRPQICPISLCRFLLNPELILLDAILNPNSFMHGCFTLPEPLPRSNSFRRTCVGLHRELYLAP